MFSRKHYEPYEYHGDAYSKYDVNRDGVDDRLDLDRNGKIDKYEAKYKHGYGVHPHKHHHSNDKYPKYPKKYEYHKKDDKDHYAPSYAKKHAPHYAHKLSDSYDANRKWGRKSTSYSSKHDYDTKKHDGYGSYSGVSYGKRKTRAHGYDDDNKYLKVPSFHSRSKHSDYYDKKDYDYDYKKDRKYDLYEKDYGYARRHRRYHGKDDHPDGKSYDKYDVTDYDLHPDGKYSKTNTKVYRATSYHKHGECACAGDTFPLPPHVVWIGVLGFGHQTSL